MKKPILQKLPQFPSKPKENWFDHMLKGLNINKVPPWPDNFGKALRNWFKKNKVERVKTLSLFTGAGGLDIGFHDANFEIIEMVEKEKKFVDTLIANRDLSLSGIAIKCMDIREYIPDQKLKVDFIIGGPPCQPFSAAGRRAHGVQGTNDPRGTLFHEYVRLIKQLKPKAFLFENVYGIIGAQEGRAWEEITNAFKEAGYEIFFRILDAADYGVPQHRERLIIVGTHNFKKEFLFPFPTHGPDSTNEAKFYTAGEAVKNASNTEDFKQVNGKYGKLLNDIPEGLNYSYYTKEMGHPRPVFAWRSKFSDFLYKADPKKPVRAIKAQGGQYTGPFSWENRFFTTSELKRLQTFPDDYKLVGNRGVVIHQIGNSVPPQLARNLALAVLDQIFKKPMPSKTDYMPKKHQLTFRRRKRGLTDEYREKAIAGFNKLAHMYSASSKSKQNLTFNNNVRFINPINLDWSSQYRMGYIKVKIENEVNTDNWIIKATIKNNFKKPIYKIRISPRNGSWSIPFNKVGLVSYDKDKITLTAIWKTFEENLSKVVGYADIVQLSGYYQYQPKILTNITINENLKDDVFWRFIDLVMNNKLPDKLVELNYLLNVLNCNHDKLIKALSEMKQVGFEIRNKKTNPQIKDNYFLIPYSFPTLNPKSVQLYKSLI